MNTDWKPWFCCNLPNFPISCRDFADLLWFSCSPILIVITGCAWGQFSTPHRIHTPWPITKKLRRRPLRLCQIWCRSVHEGLLGKWVKYNENFIYLFIPFFINSPTGQTRRRIFTLDSSNDADSRKDVPFGGIVYIVSHFGGEIPPKPQFWGRE